MSNAGSSWMDHRDELLDRVVREGRARKVRRRAFFAATSVLVVALAIAAGLSLTSQRTNSLHVANSNNEPTTSTTSPSTRPAGVLLIGDAVMLGARDELERAIPNARVDAGISRQFMNAIDIVVTDAHLGEIPQTVVIFLGTNGAIADDQFDRVMQEIGPESTVFFVTVNVPRPWETSVNDALARGVDRWPNARLLDWKDAARSHAEWFTNDGFHLTPAGAAAFAAFVRDRVRPTGEPAAVPTDGGNALAVDLDGDGRADQLRLTRDAVTFNSPSTVTATLANGRVVSGTLPGGYSVAMLGAADIGGDGRQEVFVRNGGETWTVGEIIVLDGDRLVAVPAAGDPLVLGWGAHSNSNPRGTADVACRVVGGRASLVVTDSTLDGSLVRHWHRAVYALEGAQLVLQYRDSGALPMSSAPTPDLPLANRLDCGTASG